jgi:hypothetical protein
MKKQSEWLDQVFGLHLGAKAQRATSPAKNQNFSACMDKGLPTRAARQ